MNTQQVETELQETREAFRALRIALDDRGLLNAIGAYTNLAKQHERDVDILRTELYAKVTVVISPILGIK